MLRKYVMPALLSLACVLMVTDLAHAQRRGGGNRGGWNSGGWGNYNRGWGNYNNSGWGVTIGPGGVSFGTAPYYGYGSGYYGSGYYGSGYYGNRYYSPYYGSNYGWGNRYYSPGYYSSYYSPSYYDSGYSYSYPSTSYPSTSFYYTPAETAQRNDDSAQIRVIVPDANARVWFDGTQTQQTGTDRLFHTPPLNASVSNSYRIRASWTQGGQEVTQERVVNVTPGGTAVADFR
jgi:uncharacterized protein (TIGR03000 family)